MKEAFPFFAAIAMYALGPMLAKKAIRQVTGWIATAKPYSDSDPDKVPGYLAPAQLEAYIEYAADVVQIAPAIVLTTVGIVLALPDNMSPVTASTIMMVMVIALIAADTIVLSIAPHQYVIRKWRGFSFIAGVGIAVNLIGAVATLCMAYA